MWTKYSMTAIEIPAHVALPRQYTYWHMTASSLDEALAVFARRYPHYDTTVYYCGTRFWFVMDFRRDMA